MAKRAIEIAEHRLVQDHYPEYYDGRSGRLIGKEARLYQTWSITGLLAAKEFITHSEQLALISLRRREDPSCKA